MDNRYGRLILNRISVGIPVISIAILGASFSVDWLRGLHYESHADTKRTEFHATSTFYDSKQKFFEFPPWRAEFHARHAEKMILLGKYSEGDRLYSIALRQASLNMGIWQSLIDTNTGMKRFSPVYPGMLRFQLKMAPSSRLVNLHNALNGLAFWEYGSEEIQELWEIFILFELKHDWRRFLKAVFSLGQENRLCGNFSEENSQLGVWCGKAWRARQRCFKDDLSKSQLNFCQRMGAYIIRPRI